MNQLTWKIKVTVLWLFSILNLTAVLLIPGSMELIVAQMGDATGLVISVYYFLTCLMIWLTVVLEPRKSRWPIIVIAAYYAFVKIMWIITAVSGEIIVNLFVTETWGLVVALATIWYGWKIPAKD